MRARNARFCVTVQKNDVNNLVRTLSTFNDETKVIIDEEVYQEEPGERICVEVDEKGEKTIRIFKNHPGVYCPDGYVRLRSYTEEGIRYLEMNIMRQGNVSVNTLLHRKYYPSPR